MPTSKDPATRFASMLDALSQPTRLKIIEIVGRGSSEGTPAGQIAAAVHCPPSTLSFHLKELSQAGLLAATPEGRFIRYRVEPAAFDALAAFVGQLPGGTAQGQQPGRSARRSPSRRRAGERKAGRDQGQLSIFDE